MARPQYGQHHVNERERVLQEQPICVHCGVRPSTVADHQPPIALHEHINGSGCCEYFGSCAVCSAKQGGKLRQMVGKHAGDLVEFEEPEPVAGPWHDMWQVDWLTDLLEVPEDATWPRFMTAPHPDAVGSYGAEFETYVRDRWKTELYWWQRLCARRLLEHDDDGVLVWYRWLLTVARQLGKSRLLLELLRFALTAPQRFAPSGRLSLLASHITAAAELVVAEFVKEARAKVHPEWDAKGAVGRVSFENTETGAECLVKAMASVYGLPVVLGLVDEIWNVPEEHVSEGLDPTVLATEGQLGFTSTAHRKATSLALNLRGEAFKTLAEPDDLLVLEWSTPPTFALDDEEGWKLASPRWTKRRAKLLARKLEAAQKGETLDPTEPDPLAAFEAQYLNRWPLVHQKRGVGLPLVDVEGWVQALDAGIVPKHQLVAAMEDNLGHGAAVAVAGISETERICFSATEFESRDEAWAFLGELGGVDNVLLGASLVNDPKSRNVVGFVDLRTTAHLRDDAALFRDMLAHGNVYHDGDPATADQFTAARVRENPSGLSFVAGKRHDVCKAAIWAVAEVSRQRGAQPGVF